MYLVKYNIQKLIGNSFQCKDSSYLDVSQKQNSLSHLKAAQVIWQRGTMKNGKYIWFF